MNQVLDYILGKKFESFFLIAGPCAIESYETSHLIAQEMKQICAELDIPYIFKGSFKKANRTKFDSFKGIGDADAIKILRAIKEEFDLPTTTDIHEIVDVQLTADAVDLIQIPAFLCRQTDLILAAARTGKPVNIKKGQFMSGASMLYGAEKVRSVGNDKVMLTERGNSFGYSDLVVDGRNVDVMARKELVVMDTTHATQRTNQVKGISGGNPDEIELMGRIGLSSGALGIFMEVHPDPSKASSDAGSMLALGQASNILRRWKSLSLSLRSIYG